MSTQQLTREEILCAAIWFKTGKSETGHKPKNIDTGVVVCAHRHAHCFTIFNHIAETTTVKSRQDIGVIEEEQGFLTSHNRFVNREEGAAIFIACGGKPQFTKRLFSEDLY